VYVHHDRHSKHRCNPQQEGLPEEAAVRRRVYVDYVGSVKYQLEQEIEQAHPEGNHPSRHRTVAVCGHVADVPLVPERGLTDRPDERRNPAPSAGARGNPQSSTMFRHYGVPGVRGLRWLCRTAAEPATSMVT